METSVADKVPEKGVYEEKMTIDEPKPKKLAKKSEPNRIVVETETVDSSPLVNLIQYDAVATDKDDRRETMEALMSKDAQFEDKKDVKNGVLQTGGDEEKDKASEPHHLLSESAAPSPSGQKHISQQQSSSLSSKAQTQSQLQPQYVTQPQAQNHQHLAQQEAATDELQQEQSQEQLPVQQSTSAHALAQLQALEETQESSVQDAAAQESSQDTLQPPNSNTLLAGQVTSNAPHSAYTRSLRNKRSILMDSVTPSVSNVAANTQAPNSTTNVGVATSLYDADNRSIKSTSKKSKQKPRLKKITSSRADIFEAQVEGALHNDQNSDGNETFVYESRGHSRDNSTNTIDLAKTDTIVEVKTDTKPLITSTSTNLTQQNFVAPFGTSDSGNNANNVSVPGPANNSATQPDDRRLSEQLKSSKKSYKRPKLSNRSTNSTYDSHDELQRDVQRERVEKESRFDSNSLYKPSSVASSIHDMDLDAASTVDDQGSFTEENQYYFDNKVSKKEKKPAYLNDYNLSSGHSSESEMDYTTDDVTYHKFTRYKKSRYGSQLGSQSNNGSHLNLVNNLNLGSINGHVERALASTDGYLSRHSSVANFRRDTNGTTASVSENVNNTNNNVSESNNGTVVHKKAKRQTSRSPLINYHPSFRNYVRNKSRYGALNDNGSVKTSNYGSYAKQGNPLKTTVAKLFDNQGGNLKRISGVADDFNSDMEDEIFDDDYNIFGYDNESAPLDMEYYHHTLNNKQKLFGMHSVDDPKMGLLPQQNMHTNADFSYYSPKSYYNEHGNNNNNNGRNGGLYRRRSGSVAHTLQSVFWGVLLMVLFLSLGFMCGFFLASSKDLMDVSIVALKHVLASVDELVLDVQCEGLNPGFTSIIVNDVDLDLFVKTRYLEPSDGDEFSGIFTYETFFIGNVKKLEYPLVFPSNPFEKKAVEAISGLRLLDPGKNSTDPTYNDEFYTKGESGQQKNWRIAIKHPFELIVRGKFNYKLPFSGTIKAAAVHKSVSVDPAGGLALL